MLNTHTHNANSSYHSAVEDGQNVREGWKMERLHCVEERGTVSSLGKTLTITCTYSISLRRALDLLNNTYTNAHTPTLQVCAVERLYVQRSCIYDKYRPISMSVPICNEIHISSDNSFMLPRRYIIFTYVHSIGI